MKSHSSFCSKVIFVLGMIFAIPFTGEAQNSVRLKIDQEREEENLAYTDPKVFEKSRKFIRDDSTYYVGYLLQGAYLYGDYGTGKVWGARYRDGKIALRVIPS